MKLSLLVFRSRSRLFKKSKLAECKFVMVPMNGDASRCRHIRSKTTIPLSRSHASLAFRPMTDASFRRHWHYPLLLLRLLYYVTLILTWPSRKNRDKSIPAQSYNQFNDGRY